MKRQSASCKYAKTCPDPIVFLQPKLIEWKTNRDPSEFWGKLQVFYHNISLKQTIDSWKNIAQNPTDSAPHRGVTYFVQTAPPLPEVPQEELEPSCHWLDKASVGAIPSGLFMDSWEPKIDRKV